MKKIELNKSLAYRLEAWKRFEEGAVVCCKRSCTVEAKRTDAGPLCFGHYIEEPDCKEDGCFNPAIASKPTQVLCRKHYVEGDGEVAREYTSRRIDEIVSSSCMLSHCAETSGVGSSSSKNKKRKRGKHGG